MESAGPVIERLDRSKIKYITIDGITTRYYEDGRGESLVLFPGGNYASLYSLDAFTLNFEGLAKHFHVFAIDKLGQGHSGNPLHDRYPRHRSVSTDRVVRNRPNPMKLA